MLKIFSLIILCLFTATTALALPAFPSAEGFGSTTIGGREGTIIHVTNLNNSGTGSFREAVTTSGARIVVFDLGGTIDISSTITITNPNLTIAGQTAPGGGITIKGGTVSIRTNDVIVRGMRFRAGLGNGDSLEIAQTAAYNIIIDHCSMSWATDENFSTWYDPSNITVQFSIISEGITPDGSSNGLGMLLGGFDDGDERDSAMQISIHHNLFAHNRDRSARIKQNTQIEFINNLVYGWQWYATRTSSEVNIVGNHYKTSPAWTGGRGVAISPYTTFSNGTVYVSHNIGPNRTTDEGEEWDIVNGSIDYKATVPQFSLSNVTIDLVEDVYDKILADVGANIFEDAVDARILADVAAGTGTWDIRDEEDVGGYPTLAPGTPITDTDDDGMPDSWETAEGTNPSVADDDLYTLNDDYTNIEMYINELMGESAPDPTGYGVVGNGISIVGEGTMILR